MDPKKEGKLESSRSVFTLGLNKFRVQSSVVTQIRSLFIRSNYTIGWRRNHVLDHHAPSPVCRVRHDVGPGLRDDPQLRQYRNFIAASAEYSLHLLYAWPPVFRIALAFPLLAIPLTLGCLYFVVRAWREGFWTRYGRMQYTVIALAFTLFLWSLNHIKLLGYHFG
jgi:hypothetical protein